MKKTRNIAYQLLRRSEGLFKTDMIYLVKGSFWLNGAQLINALVIFVLAIALANILTQETYGTYKYILSIAGLFGSITLSGLGSALSRAVAKGFEGEFVRSIKLNLKWETMILIAGILGAYYYYLNGNNTLALGLLIIGIFSPLKDSAELYPAYLAGKRDFKSLGLFSAFRAMTTSIWLLGTILLTKNPILIVASYFLIHTIVNSALSLWVLKSKRPNNLLSNETISLAKHTSIMNNLAVFSDTIDNVLIFHYFGPAQLAIYNFSIAIPNQLGGLMKSISTLAMPKFVNQDKSEFQRTMFHKSILVLLFGLGLAILYILIAPFIFRIFFPQYIDSVPYSQVYSIVLLFSAALPVAFLDAQIAIRQKYIATISSNIFKIVAIFFGLYYFGLWGLIIGRVVSKIYAVSTAFIFAKRV